MLRDALQFVEGLVEVSAAVASILLVGLLIAVAAFWILSRVLGKIGDPPAGSESIDEEEYGHVSVPIPPGDTSVPPEDGS